MEDWQCHISKVSGALCMDLLASSHLKTFILDMPFSHKNPNFRRKIEAK